MQGVYSIYVIIIIQLSIRMHGVSLSAFLRVNGLQVKTNKNTTPKTLLLGNNIVDAYQISENVL